MRLVCTALALSLLLAFVPACKRHISGGSEVKDAGGLTFKASGEFRFDRITPSGQKVFAQSVQWMFEQDDDLAMASQCATNVSAVFMRAGFGNAISSPTVDGIVNMDDGTVVVGVIKKVEDATGGKVVRFETKSKDAIMKTLNEEFGGRIPAGAFVAGCLNTSCEGEAGDGHIAILGDIDQNGYTTVYHNNWYRPNEDDLSERAFKPYMISRDHYLKGRPRQWMPTPWVKFVRDASGLIIDMIPAYPSMHGVDDLDFFTYFGRIGVIKEIWSEVQAGQVQTKMALVSDNAVVAKGSAGKATAREGGGYLRRSHGLLSILGISGACLMPAGTTVGFVSSEKISDKWMKISVKNPIRECAEFKDDLYIFTENFGIQFTQ